MPEILVISGKGGTGKTSLVGTFAHLAQDPVICDLDVDTPDLHLLLNPKVERTEEFFSGHQAVIDPRRCTSCGLCQQMCRYQAITNRGQELTPTVDEHGCEGCKVCVQFCPAQAIKFPKKHCGHWFISRTRFGPLVHAQLFPGQENSGRLVSLLRQQAKDLARRQARNLILCDGAPGIGCPVISSLTGVNLSVIVIEPTPSGRHDLERVIELCAHFRVPAAVIINRYDLNDVMCSQIESVCVRNKLPLLAKIPHDSTFVQAMLAGRVVTEQEKSDLSDIIENGWRAIVALAGQNTGVLGGTLPPVQLRSN
jgi:MinD superfamily P-loop ATPase